MNEAAERTIRQKVFGGTQAAKNAGGFAIGRLATSLGDLGEMFTARAHAWSSFAFTFL